jgi:hypothetical protein
LFKARKKVKEVAVEPPGRSEYKTRLPDMARCAQKLGATSFAVVKELKTGDFLSFPVVGTDTAQSLKSDYDDGRYFEFREIIQVSDVK